MNMKSFMHNSTNKMFNRQKVKLVIPCHKILLSNKQENPTSTPGYIFKELCE